MNFDFTKTYSLENDRVLLRPLEKPDLENLLPYSLNEPELWKYSFLQPVGKDMLEKYIDLAIAARTAEKEYPFIVFDKLKNKYAGSTRFYDVQLTNKNLQLGYTWYGSEFHGTGLNKNCKLLMLQFAFEELQIERVEFRANNTNEKSKAAMKSIGCVVEGVLRNYGLAPGGRRSDSVVLSILKEEWNSEVRKNLLNKLKSSF